MKSSERADYSVGTVWQVQDEGRQLHLVDLVRDRFEFPDLVKAAVSLHRKWEFDGRYQNLIIEDKGSGTSLIQALKQQRIYAETQNINMSGDKIMRLEAQTQQFAGGIVHFPKHLGWKSCLRSFWDSRACATTIRSTRFPKRSRTSRGLKTIESDTGE
jgi:predicted phage terminase large subunit-like protein